MELGRDKESLFGVLLYYYNRSTHFPGRCCFLIFTSEKANSSQLFLNTGPTCTGGSISGLHLIRTWNNRKPERSSPKTVSNYHSFYPWNAIQLFSAVPLHRPFLAANVGSCWLMIPECSQDYQFDGLMSIGIHPLLFKRHKDISCSAKYRGISPN